ncbi:DUF6415 family natural product biosynthesis protein [Streptomyces sp. NPDC048182]|uniref:DUF6415 family natural product biosynthesis protein n=1 Tax=Streptomyces sp. NPDC048182 TaxID=3365507 RepID=UPI003715D93B
MANGTAREAAQPRESSELPVDLETIRSAAHDVLTDGRSLTDPDEAETIILLLRGMIRLLVHEVHELASRLPREDNHRARAFACIAEARMRLRLKTEYAAHAVLVSLAQRLARTVGALADHYESLKAAP